MTGFDIARQRLHNQSIAPQACDYPGAVVRQLGAIQAQDYGSALWAIGLRMKAGSVPTTVQTIEQAIAERQIIRTWPMRGTLHFVAPEDVRWMLALLTPRVSARSTRYHEQLNLDDATFQRAGEQFSRALEGNRQLTRAEMLDVLEQDGITITGQRGYHMLRWAAQHGLICIGPRQGKQDTFVWLDDWLPSGATRSREESLDELAHRYFSGHGPATIQDFMWWSGLAAGDARTGLEMAQSRLVSEVVDGTTYGLEPNTPTRQPETPAAHLLPGFDEYLLGYRERDAILDPAHAKKVVPGGNGVFKPLIVIDGQIVGVWKRTLRKTKVIIEFMPFTPLNSAQMASVVAAAEPYGRFLQLPVEIKQ